MRNMIRKNIKVAGGKIEAYLLPLADKNLILLRASKGYVMCGYLNLAAAEKFKDAAVVVKGVSTIDEVLNARVHSCTSFARLLGIKKLQPIREVLKLIV